MLASWDEKLERGRHGYIVDAEVPDADLRQAIAALAGSVEVLAQEQDKLSAARDVVAKAAVEIAKIKLEPGDVLVLKLGDAACGWIPEVAAGERVAELFRTALKDVGVNNPIVTWNYGLAIEKVSTR